VRVLQLQFTFRLLVHQGLRVRILGWCAVSHLT
jgi:hypothetical protein